MAAACLGRLDTIGKEGRKLVSFGKDEVAGALIHDEWTQATEFIGLTEYAVESGEPAERVMRGEKISPDSKIRMGQRLLELKARTGKKFDTDGHALNADGTREGEPTGKTSISESNRLWFARQGLDNNVGQTNGDS